MYMMRQFPTIEKKLLFGVQDKASLFYQTLFKHIPKLELYIFLSREKAAGFNYGRVDISKLTFEKESEFYICGNPPMVKDTIAALAARGFEKIYHEQF